MISKPDEGSAPELSDTAALQAAIVASSRDAILSQDLNGILTSWNDGAERLLGYTAEEALGRPVTLLIPADQHDDEPRILETIRRGEGIDRYETLWRRKDGCLIDASLTVSPIRDAAGRVVGAARIVRDITGRKQAEVASAHLAAIVASSSDAIISKDLNGVLTSWNAGAERLFGYTAEEAVGQPVMLLIPADHHDEEPRILERIRRGDVIEHYETVRQRKDGSRVEVSLTVSPIRDASGRIIGASKIARDITGRRRAEEAVARLAAIVASSEDAIVSKDLNGVLTSWNAGAERLFGYTEEEAVGRSVTLLIPADHQDEEPGILEKIRRGELIDPYETVRRRKDGSLVDVSLTVSPIRDASGRVVGASKIARDVTERKRAEALQREGDRRKDEFLAMLGHELRNPVAAVTYGLERLRQVSNDPGRVADLTAMMTRQTQRVTLLLDQLLDLARVNSGAIALRRVPLDLAAVIRSALETVAPAIHAGRHQLDLELADDVVVSGDAVRLAQVVENLVGNAAKYMDPEGRIRVKLESSGDEARISVSDTGVGISAEFIPQLFALFTQARRPLDRAKGGLGLGLPLVKRLVELHGGRVAASSPGLGQGSEFVVTLPTLPERAPAVRRSGAGPQEASLQADEQARYRVLVVDDEESSAWVLAELLKADGHEPRTASDGPTALAAAREFDPEVVLLDLGLPGMDGYEVATKLREAHDDLLLIALTGYRGDPDRLEQSGFDAHLLKPLDTKKLASLLAQKASRTAGP